MSAENEPSGAASERGRALLILAVMPVFFSSNIIFGRAATGMVEPFTLAFLRWSLTALALAPLVAIPLWSRRSELKELTLPLFGMGFLGMWICGALVYLALKYTTATNGTLIYTSSPAMIILIEWLFRGRQIGWREAAGVALAFVGVLIIVVEGSLDNLLAMSFNLGDLIFVGTALSWAIYSVCLKSPAFQAFPTLPLFALIAGAGAILLLPFALTEGIYFQRFPTGVAAWTNITGIVIIASLLAFSTFQYGVKVLGASLAGVFLYLLPVYGVALAVLFLGETLAMYHAWGALFVAGGVILATASSFLGGHKR